ncbi:MAG: TolC family protein [Candidatus Latescibacterota bacterium]
MQRMHIAVLATLCLVAASAVGSTPPAEPALSLSALVEEALQANPEILQAEKTLEMARAKAPQEKALPDPMLQFDLQNIGLTEYTVGKMDMSMAGLSVRQAIPYPGKRRLREEVALKEAATTAEMVEVTRRSVVARVKAAYYDLAFVDRSLDVVARMRRVLQDFAETAQSRYSVGQGMQQDVLKAQVEVSMLVQRTASLEQRRQGTAAMLNSLLDRPPGAPLGQTEELAPPRPLPPVEELEGRATERSPELRARQRSVEADQVRVRQMRREYQPDFAVSAGWRSRGHFDDAYQVMVEVELPWQRERRRYGVLEAGSALAASEKGRRATEEMVLAQVRDLASMAQTAGRLAEVYQTTIIPQARYSLESATAGYRVGSVDLLMLLDNVRVLLDNELMVQEELAEHHRAVARLEEVVGTSVGQ